MRAKNIIISIICALIVLMAIDYVVFAATLNTNGTANITSNWKVFLASIETSNFVGEASDLVYDETLNPDGTRIVGNTAYFKTELVNPGDAVTYSVVVTNEGTIDARLASINITNSNNRAIIYSVSGLNENDILAANDSKTLLLNVAYNSDITSQLDILTSSLIVTLDFVQA